MSKFIHLKLHSEYSIVDGIVKIKPLMQALNKLKMPAIAINDHSNLFAVVKIYKAARAAGIKPIIGAEVVIKDEKNFYSCTILCTSELGYSNLIQLISKAYTDGQIHGAPYVCYEWIAEHSKDILILSGAQQGDVGQAILNNDLAAAKKYLDFWIKHFPGSYYLEIQRLGRPSDNSFNQKITNLAEEFSLPLIATNDVRFILEEDYEAHEARVCIQQGHLLHAKNRPHNYTPQQFLRSSEEMEKLFSDIPEALENTIEIAKRCNVLLRLGENFLPNFEVPKGMSAASYLIKLSQENLELYLPKMIDMQAADALKQREVYDARLERELCVINAMGFPGYFLIVADFISWAKNNDVPVGPGRGSGAGSLVAYVLGITDINPLTYDLLFERFLNPERVSMPDFDIDFCMDGRDRVIEYVANKYGRASVSQIITFGTMAAKAVVRDVGRVLGHGYGFVDKLAKLIPFEIGMTLKKALDTEDLLLEKYKNDEEVATLLNLAMKLEGITRNAGKHAGGVVISPSLLTDFAALYCEEGGGNLVTQLDKDDVESIGLVKFDFLGLRTLTIIKWALENINAQRASLKKDPLDLTAIPMDDSATFVMLQACDTSAVFQLESRGMKDLIKRLKPDCFEEIIALVALFRPGPLQSGMVDDFIDRKHGRAPVLYPHPDLEPILSPTYGVILYQEQVMQIAQVLAGYTLGGADILRRAMGKKKPEEMAQQGKIFVKGATAKGVDPEVATGIFDLMEKFAGYGFNKSHSAAYALISYQTAWLKTHYTAEFMAAVLSSDMDNTDKVVMMVEECQKLKLKVRFPNINTCQYNFTVAPDKTIIYGLGAIKGVGHAAIAGVVAERSANGEFNDLFDFCRRVDSHKINKRVLEALVKAGAFDVFFNGDFHKRSTLFTSLAQAVKASDQLQNNKASFQNDLFGSGECQTILSEYNDSIKWQEQQRLKFEKDVLGLYVSGHPIDEYLPELKFIAKHRLAQLEYGASKKGVLAGLVKAVRVMLTKRGDKMAFIRLDDNSAAVEVVVFSDVYDAARDIITKDNLLVIEAEFNPDEYSGGYRIQAKNIYTVAQAREIYAKRIEIKLCDKDLTAEDIVTLKNLLIKNRGACPVVICYKNTAVAARLQLGPKWRARASAEFLTALADKYTAQTIKIVYNGATEN